MRDLLYIGVKVFLPMQFNYNETRRRWNGGALLATKMLLRG